MTIIAEISEAIQEILIETAKEQESILIERRGGKVTGENLCQTLVFGWMSNPEATLEELAQMGMNVGLEISPQGLEQRFTERTATYLQAILAKIGNKAIKGKEVAIPILNRFTQVYLEDSSVITLPTELATVWQGCGGNGKRSKSAVKLQVRLDINQGELNGPFLVDGREPDTRASEAHQPLPASTLLIRDLGYWKLDNLEFLDHESVYWLSYLKTNTHFYVDGIKYQLANYLAKCDQETVEIPIELGARHHIPARLIARRVSTSVAAQRRRQQKRKAQKKGQPLSHDRLALCDWVILVTNLPASLLSSPEAFVLIRVRWQIELLFKLWKSHAHLDKSRSQKPWRQLCEFYAKLIGVVLQHWLLVASVWQFADRSLVKAATTIRKFALSIALSLSKTTILAHTLHILQKSLTRGCRINRSLATPRTYQLLLALEDSS